MTLDDLLAREEIRYTMSVYATAGDRGRVDELVTAFTEDGVLMAAEGQEGIKGRAAILAALGGSVDAARSEHSAGGPAAGVKLFLRHNLTTSRIELTGPDSANAWTYFNVVTPAGFDHCGVYVDRFTKVDDRWLIAERRVKIDWHSPNSTMIHD
jgi:SnoaL-like domain